jgi:hypothetical protein
MSLAIVGVHGDTDNLRSGAFIASLRRDQMTAEGVVRGSIDDV